MLGYIAITHCVSPSVVVQTVDLGGGLFHMTPDNIDRHLDVNVRATLRLIKEVAIRSRASRVQGASPLFQQAASQRRFAASSLNFVTIRD